MKLADFVRKQLKESPYMMSGEYHGEYSSTFTPDHIYMTDHNPNLQDSYLVSYKLSTAQAKELNADEIRVFYKQPHTVLGVLPGQRDEVGRPSNLLVFRLNFRQKPDLPEIPAQVDQSKILHVSSVFLDHCLHGFGLASFVYMYLAAQGFFIVSDYDQFKPAKQLWLSLAVKAKSEGLMITVFNRMTGEFVKNSAGDVEFDGSNIEHDEIWSSALDEIVLMLSKRP
jgi:hypothetical protein